MSELREPIPEQRLMQAVILTAIADACGQSSTCSPAEAVENKRGALRWLTDAGSEFRRVCYLAGLDPDTVRTFALGFIESGEAFPRTHRNGGGRPTTRNPFSIIAIAAHAGVSPAAVGAVLNHDRGSRAMKARVQQAMREIAEQQALAA